MGSAIIKIGTALLAVCQPIMINALAIEDTTRLERRDEMG